jgi:hypothetical protein
MTWIIINDGLGEVEDTAMTLTHVFGQDAPVFGWGEEGSFRRLTRDGVQEALLSSPRRQRYRHFEPWEENTPPWAEQLVSLIRAAARVSIVLDLALTQDEYSAARYQEQGIGLLGPRTAARVLEEVRSNPKVEVFVTTSYMKMDRLEAGGRLRLVLDAACVRELDRGEDWVKRVFWARASLFWWRVNEDEDWMRDYLDGEGRLHLWPREATEVTEREPALAAQPAR